MEVGIPHTLRMSPGLRNLGRNLKRWYSGFNGGSTKLAEKVTSGRLRNFKDFYLNVEQRNF
jgi:hypothetical protein